MWCVFLLNKILSMVRETQKSQTFAFVDNTNNTQVPVVNVLELYITIIRQLLFLNEQIFFLHMYNECMNEKILD